MVQGLGRCPEGHAVSTKGRVWGNWKTERAPGSWGEGECPKTGVCRQGIRAALPCYVNQHIYWLISFPPSLFWIGLSLVLRRVPKNGLSWAYRRQQWGKAVGEARTGFKYNHYHLQVANFGNVANVLWVLLSVKLLSLPQNVVTELNTTVGLMLIMFFSFHFGRK